MFVESIILDLFHFFEFCCPSQGVFILEDESIFEGSIKVLESHPVETL